MHWPVRYYRNLFRAQLANTIVWAFVGYGEYARYDVAGSAWKSALVHNEENSALALSVVQSQSLTGISLAVILAVVLPIMLWIAVGVTELVAALLDQARNRRIFAGAAPVRALLIARAHGALHTIGAAAGGLAMRRTVKRSFT